MSRRKPSECNSCKGRGWKMVSLLGRLRDDEHRAAFEVRACSDCNGVPKTEHPNE
ncbi:hypothetical protein [Dactylosporangium sp. CA-233914]|uniref:hypothetical protein n=1 Tax=Dactylosporangium sp. CA-233914 TaxID=3239934 RepID=UPI003D905135